MKDVVCKYSQAALSRECLTVKLLFYITCFPFHHKQDMNIIFALYFIKGFGVGFLVFESLVVF